MWSTSLWAEKSTHRDLNADQTQNLLNESTGVLISP